MIFTATFLQEDNLGSKPCFITKSCDLGPHFLRSRAPKWRWFSADFFSTKSCGLRPHFLQSWARKWCYFLADVFARNLVVYGHILSRIDSQTEVVFRQTFGLHLVLNWGGDIPGLFSRFQFQAGFSSDSRRLRFDPAKSNYKQEVNAKSWAYLTI